MIREKLMNIQSELKAPKGQMNKFGGYKYRSCEDIVEAVKPLLKKNSCILTLSDELINLGDRYYVQATATLSDVKEDDRIVTKALAREDENKKGMDKAQITGSASSYARKYALNGLLGIDDTKDSDATNDHGKSNTKPKSKPKKVKKISEDEILEIEKLLSDTKSDKDKFLKWLKSKFNASKIEDLAQVDYAKVVSALSKKKGD